MNKNEIAATPLYNSLKQAVMYFIKTHTDQIVEDIMPLFERFVNDQYTFSERIKIVNSMNAKPVIAVKENSWWSEEDKNILNQILSDAEMCMALTNRQIRWLQNLQKRINNESL